MLFSKLKKVEFFRGDSFQMVIDAPENAMKIAVLLRAGLRSCTPKECKKPWDVRLSLGVGTISYYANNTAFRLGSISILIGFGVLQIIK